MSVKTIHLIGLFSDEVVNNFYMPYWTVAIENASKSGAKRLILHLITDGANDKKSLITSWRKFITIYKDWLDKHQNKIFIGSLGGRSYAMNKDNNWDRIAKGLLPMLSYKIVDSSDIGQHKAVIEYLNSKYNLNLLIDRLGSVKTDHIFFLKGDREERESEKKNQLSLDIMTSIELACERSYQDGIFDESIKPCSFYYYDSLNGKENRILPPYEIKKNDTVWFVDFYLDEMEQLTQMLTDLNEELNLGLTILTNHDWM
jgi:bisphosphoglycerate-independent phosphoglycerate mutase (AlkP superfamily)